MKDIIPNTKITFIFFINFALIQYGGELVYKNTFFIGGVEILLDFYPKPYFDYAPDVFDVVC